jgi:hypothetical protein
MYYHAYLQWVRVSSRNFSRTAVTNDDQVTQDSIRIEATGTGTATLKEIDFRHQKQALVFDQNPGGM